MRMSCVCYRCCCDSCAAPQACDTLWQQALLPYVVVLRRGFSLPVCGFVPSLCEDLWLIDWTTRALIRYSTGTTSLNMNISRISSSASYGYGPMHIGWLLPALQNSEFPQQNFSVKALRIADHAAHSCMLRLTLFSLILIQRYDYGYG